MSPAAFKFLFGLVGQYLSSAHAAISTAVAPVWLPDHA
ncbi:hypothetical protein COLO4_34923 [Corchorus olitorius]|uniref:Uncharacterized protein n=1 Tax=Corchorus olitorius TaxID=93759 RepID=A0A1R3GIV4_9ROSI|nr:hypothetical protein COLO4_34923 [Corchorus olitorius]